MTARAMLDVRAGREMGLQAPKNGVAPLCCPVQGPLPGLPRHRHTAEREEAWRRGPALLPSQDLLRAWPALISRVATLLLPLGLTPREQMWPGWLPRGGHTAAPICTTHKCLQSGCGQAAGRSQASVPSCQAVPCTSYSSCQAGTGGLPELLGRLLTGSAAVC